MFFSGRRLYHDPQRVALDPDLDSDDIARAAVAAGIPAAVVLAFAVIESRATAFAGGQQPIIRIEGHWWRRKAYNARARADLPSPLNPNDQNARWGNFQHLYAIDPDAAIYCTSFGAFQIMGFNHERCGYTDVQAFYSAMRRSAGAQALAFARFVKSQPRLVAALSRMDTTPCETIVRGKRRKYPRGDLSVAAEIYNGVQYARNAYDLKLLASITRINKEGHHAILA